MKRVAIVIWILIAGLCVSSGLAVVDSQLTILPFIFGFGWGVIGLGLGYYYRYQHWRLNRKKNPMSWRYRIKKMKPVITTSEEHRVTLTNRYAIAFFTILSFLLVGWLCYVLKVDNIHSFYVASGAGFTILGMLLALYFIRRKRKQIAKFVPPARITKVGFIVSPFVLWLVIIWGSSLLTRDGWQFGILYGGFFAILFWGGMALRVRKTGWKKFSWDDAVRGASKAVMKGAQRGWASRVGNPFGRRVSFGNIDYHGVGSNFQSDYNEQLRKDREWRKWLDDHN